MPNDKDRIITDAIDHLREVSKFLRWNGFEDMAATNDKMAAHFERQHNALDA